MSDKTLRDLFPGNLGRLALSTVVLRLKKPELMAMSMDAPISEDLAHSIEAELAALKEGR